MFVLSAKLIEKPHPEPSKSALERAAQIRRIEESSRSDVNLKDRMNEDRERARLPPLP